MSVDAAARITTFLMGDIENSTRQWHDDPDRMRAALEAHDRIIADVVANFGGDVFKHTGDGFIAQFNEPEAALDAARRCRTGLAALDTHLTDFLGVRLAADSGWATQRDGDWFGPTVNRVARLTDVATPVGVLATGHLAGLLRQSPPDAVDLGRVRLKSHDVPIPVVGFDGAEAISPSLDSTLPAPRSEFVGRDSELEALSDLIAQHRVVSIVGPGGAGKTRLAVEVGRSVSNHSTVGFVDLLEAQEQVSTVRQIALGAGVDVDALGAIGDWREVLGHVADRLAGQRCLLIVDNCEHVIEHVREQLDWLLERAPDVGLLATTREALSVDGELVWPIPQLAADTELFRRRASGLGVDLDESPEVNAAVEEICSRLEGLPLPIEIAAAGLATVGLGELRDQLSSVLVEGVHGFERPERHRTMLGLVEWSLVGLDDDARRFFAELSLFEGRFAARDAGLFSTSSRQALTVLTQRSLIVQERDGLDLWFRMLEPVRQVGRSMLVASSTFDAAIRELGAALIELAGDANGAVFWDWATLDRLGALLPTMWSVHAWLDEQDPPMALQLIRRYSGAAGLNSQHRRVADAMSGRLASVALLEPDEQAQVLVSQTLAGIGSMSIDVSIEAVMALFELPIEGDTAPWVFAFRNQALYQMNTDFTAGRPDTSGPALAQARELLAGTDSPYEHAAVAGYTGWRGLLRGEWEEVCAVSEEGRSLIGPGSHWHLVLPANHGLALLRLGRPAEARQLAIEQTDRGRFSYMGDPLAYVEILADSQMGRHGEAQERLAHEVERVLQTTHRGLRDDLVLVAAWVAVNAGLIDDARVLASNTVGTRGPHAMQLVGGLEERCGVRPVLPGLDRDSPSDKQHGHLLEQIVLDRWAMGR